MWKESAKHLSGNERFEGFCVDMLAEISKMVGFSYKIHLVPDMTYGLPDNGVWNGMVRELLEKVHTSTFHLLLF